MSINSKKWMPTYILIALNVLAFVYTSLIGGNFPEISYDMILLYGQVNALVIGGSYWQLFTSIFIHVSMSHLLGNMLFLMIFGLRGEEMFSLSEYLLIYLMGGLAGNFLSLLLMPPWIPSAGASGAIFGMFGAATVYIRRRVGQSIIGALIYAFFLLFLSSGPNVNNLAHIGGLAAGLIIGYILGTRRKNPMEHRISYSYSIPI